MRLEVWKTSLAQVEGEVDRWKQVLSVDEARRAEGMTREAPRRQFVIGRGLLRYLLADRLGVAAEEIRFVYDGSGKPRLAPVAQGGAAKAPAEFSLSHSGDLVVFAVCWEDGPRASDESSGPRDVGVDIEWTGRARDYDGIVRRFATEIERQEYFALPPTLREAAFYRWWTRKEALIKAMGTSLARGLGAVSLPFDQESLHEIAPVGLAGSPDLSWLVATVPVEERYCLSVARPAQTWAVREAFEHSFSGKGLCEHGRLPLTLVLRW